MRPYLDRTRSTCAASAGASVTSQCSSKNRSRAPAGTRAVSLSRSFSTTHGTDTTPPSPSSRSVTAWPRAPAPPVTIATRGIALLHRGRRHHDGRALDLVVADLGHVEVLQAAAQLLERLLERGQRLAGPGQRRGAGEQIVLHVGMVDPALLH